MHLGHLLLLARLPLSPHLFFALSLDVVCILSEFCLGDGTSCALTHALLLFLLGGRFRLLLRSFLFILHVSTLFPFLLNAEDLGELGRQLLVRVALAFFLFFVVAASNIASLVRSLLRKKPLELTVIVLDDDIIRVGVLVITVAEVRATVVLPAAAPVVFLIPALPFAVVAVFATHFPIVDSPGTSVLRAILLLLFRLLRLFLRFLLRRRCLLLCEPPELLPLESALCPLLPVSHQHKLLLQGVHLRPHAGGGENTTGDDESLLHARRFDSTGPDGRLRRRRLRRVGGW